MSAPTDFLGGLAAPLKFNSQGASYTLVYADRGCVIPFTGSSAQNLTVPPNSSVPFKAGARIGVMWLGAGSVTLVPGAGVTLNVPGGSLVLAGQYAIVWLTQTSTLDTWDIEGCLRQPRVIRTVSGTSDTPSTSDLGKLIQYTSSSPVTITLDHTGLVAGDYFDGVAMGTGVVTYASSDTVYPAVAALRTQGSAGTAIYMGSSTWLLVGDFAKGSTRQVFSISANTNAAASNGFDFAYFCSGLTTTLTLPTAVGNTSCYTVKNSGSANISVGTTSSQTIDGGAAPIIIPVGQSLDFISDNANWWIV